MKKQKLIYFISFLLTTTALLPAQKVAAQARPEKGKWKTESASTLPLQTALEEALAHNAMLEAAENEAVAMEAKIKPSGALPDPAIEGRLANYPISSLSPHDFGMTGNELMLVQKFPFPGKRQWLTEIAKSEAEAGKEDARQTKLTLLQRVKTSYYDLFLSYQRERLLLEQSKLFNSLETVARSKYSLGTSPQSEVLELQLKSASILVTIEDERKHITIKRAALNHLLGREDHRSLWRPEAISATAVDLKSILALCRNGENIEANPSIQSLKSLVTAARSKVAYSDLTIYPDFEVGVGYMQRFENQDDNGEDFVSARVSITLPLWRRDKQEQEQRAARADQRKRNALLREGKIELVHLLHKAAAELSEATDKLRLYRFTVLPLSDAAITSARKSYETNQASYRTVIDLINERIEAKVAYYSSLVEHESALATIEALLNIQLAKSMAAQNK